MRRFLPALLFALAIAAPALADGCGCGGPKEFYMKKYGTIKPPAFVPATTTAAPTAAPAPTAGSAAAPVNPPATGQGG